MLRWCPVMLLACVASGCASPQEPFPTREEENTRRRQEEARLARRAEEHARVAQQLGTVLLVPSGCVSESGVEYFSGQSVHLRISGDAVDLHGVSEELQAHFARLGWKRNEFVTNDNYPLFVWKRPPRQERWQARGIYQTWHGEWIDENNDLVIYSLFAIAPVGPGSKAVLYGSGSVWSSNWPP